MHKRTPESNQKVYGSINQGHRIGMWNTYPMLDYARFGDLKTPIHSLLDLFSTIDGSIPHIKSFTEYS